MGGEDPEELGTGKHNQNILYENLFSIKKGKKGTKKTEEAGKNKPVGSIPPGSLFEFLFLDFCLEFLYDLNCELHL